MDTEKFSIEFASNQVRVLNGLPVFHYDTLLENLSRFFYTTNGISIKITTFKSILHWVHTMWIKVTDLTTDTVQEEEFVKAKRVISICIRLAVAFEFYQPMDIFLKHLKWWCTFKNLDNEWCSKSIAELISSIQMRYKIFTKQLKGTPFQYRGIYDCITDITWVSDPIVTNYKQLVFNDELRMKCGSKTLWQVSHQLRSTLKCDDKNVYIKTTDSIDDLRPDIENVMYQIILQESQYIETNVNSLFQRTTKIINVPIEAPQDRLQVP